MCHIWRVSKKHRGSMHCIETIHGFQENVNTKIKLSPNVIFHRLLKVYAFLLYSSASTLSASPCQPYLSAEASTHTSWAWLSDLLGITSSSCTHVGDGTAACCQASCGEAGTAPPPTWLGSRVSGKPWKPAMSWPWAGRFPYTGLVLHSKWQ